MNIVQTVEETVGKIVTKDIALLLLRIPLALSFIYHGLPKAMDWGMAMGKFNAMGFWGWLGPVVGILEVLGGILMLVGLFNTWTNYTLAVIMIVAILGVQLGGAISSGGLTASLERDVFMLAGNVILMAFGPGKLAWTLRK